MNIICRRFALGASGALLFASTASADIVDWLAAVASGTPASYVNSSLPGSIDDDIGLTDGTNGVTYEFIVNGTNAGVSSGLMGARNSGVGDSSGFKFEQWPDTLQYGATEFGIVDLLFPGANTENVDLQLVFVADTNVGTTELFVNGVSFGTVPSAPVLQGLQGLGQIHDPNTGAFDIWTGTMHGVAVYEAMLGLPEIEAHRDAYFGSGIGTNYCGPANLNSSGQSALISAFGSTTAAANDVRLDVTQAAQNQFGMFLNSMTPGFVVPPGSQGNLCLGGGIGRYKDNIMSTGSAGEMTLQLDLNNTPTPAGTVAIQPGETWHFQAWFRDNNPNQTSNFTDGVLITFS